MKRNIGGFTLIELMVSISIIALLSSFVLSGLNTARSKARDSQRIANMRELRTALELYRNDKNSYPNLLSDLVPNYISVLPTPPIGTSQAAYAYARYGSYPNVTSYHMGALLENTNNTLRSANCRSGTSTSGSPPQCVTGVNATAGGFNGVRNSCTNGGSAPDLCYDIVPGL